MLKPHLLTLICSTLLLPCLTFSQLVTYYDKGGRIVDSTAEFVRYEETSRLPNGWTLAKEYTKDGLLKAEGAYSVFDEKNKVAEGLHQHYYPETGQIWYLETYAAGQLSRLESFYPDGKPKRVERYKKGKFKKGKCLNPDGSERAFTRFQQQPLYPGGEKMLFQYLATNLKYPVQARDNNVQGTVLIRFVVEKTGAVSTVEIVTDPGGGCGEEAARLIREMPNWSPGRVDDDPVKVRFSLPIKFSLN